jgi:hypothetical protein
LPALAELRRWRGVRVSIEGDRAWIYWEPQSEGAPEALARHILPLPGVELFTERGGCWYRLGHRLPALGMPAGGSSRGLSLERVLLPRPITARRPEDLDLNPIPVRLVPDHRGRSRPAVALACQLEPLLAWAEQATSARVSRLLGAWAGVSEGWPCGAEVLVLGGPGTRLPLASGLRFWGADVLIPLGLRTDPELPEPALRNAVGAGSEELVLLDQDGYELIPRAVFRPLSLAGIRLAWRRLQAGRPAGEDQP